MLPARADGKKVPRSSKIYLVPLIRLCWLLSLVLYTNTALHRLKEIHRPLHDQCRLNPNLFVTGSVAVLSVLERFLCMGLVCISFTSLAGGWFLLENCASLTFELQGATVNFALESHNFGVMLTRTLRQNIRWRWKPFNLNSSFFLIFHKGGRHRQHNTDYFL